jgi:translation initiation factor 1A
LASGPRKGYGRYRKGFLRDMLMIPDAVDICGVVGITDNNQRKGNNDFDPNAVNPDGTPLVRVRLPKKWNNEMFGSADLMMGANHIRVRCFDGVTRMGRIKGKIKKRVWIREGDTLIIVPWSFQDDKCDIIYRYLPPQVDWLRKNRYL